MSAAAGAELGLSALLRERGAPLIEALEHHHPGSREHAEGTGSYAFATAVGLGFERLRCEEIREAAKLHEVGQLYVPEAVLAKPASQRDAAEQEAVEGHYEAGHRLARGVGAPERACTWLLRVGERYDGRGPDRLAAEAIPIESRIIRAACLCQTALAAPVAPQSSARAAAIEALADGAGAELDPEIVAALTAIIARAAA